ncbi:MAG: TniB family NTP-binding protein [Paracoccaceae bacterium]
MNHTDLEKTSACIVGLQAHFAKTERFDDLEQQFLRLKAKRLVEINLGQTSEARGFALIGASGTGKTTAINKLLSLHDAPNDDAACQVISLSVPSPATLKYVGQTILHTLGYEITTKREAWHIWDLVRHHLKARKILFLHLDEAQDLSAKGTEKETQTVVNMLKSLMQDKDWPVGIILSGTHRLADILNFDPQLGRRVFPVYFEPVLPERDAERFAGLVAAYAGKAKLKLYEDTEGVAFAKRLIHASAQEFGLMIELTIAAIEEALTLGSPELKRGHFALAFQRRTSCLVALNPFLVADYQRIDARQILGRLGDGQ